MNIKLRLKASAACLLLTASLAATGCHNSGSRQEVVVNTDHVSVTNVTVPDTYDFASKLTVGTSSVSYTGQVQRQLLIAGLKAHIDGLGARADIGVLSEVEVTQEFLGFFDFDPDTNGDLDIPIVTEPDALQNRYTDVSGSNLREKIAGNDPVGQHRDWATDMIGWVQAGVDTPESLVETWFEELAQRVADHSLNGPATAAVGTTWVTLESPTVSSEGLDYGQLLAKFLAGAVAYSQGTDDYLDTDTAGKGTLADNTGPDDDGDPYTALEHAWDEGFGYFGAARDYLAYTDEEIAGKGGREEYQNGYHDTDGDGRVDFRSEYNFGHSVNAAKRDLGSTDTSRTDFTRQAWDAFVTGRALIAAIVSTPTEAQQMELDSLAEAARLSWELAIASTVIHYINETLADAQSLEADPDMDWERLAGYAKHYSELKGFALSLQFNPVSMMSQDDQIRMHDLIGQAPVLATGTTLTRFQDDLTDARTLIQSVYGDGNGFTDDAVAAW